MSFNFIYRFAVDVPYWDQWEFVPMLQHQADRTLSFAELFAQHNEHRIVFPRLVMLTLAWLSRWDIRVEIYFLWMLLLGIGVLLLVEHLKAFGVNRRAALLFVPSAWLVFSLRQESNLLWGWQLGIILCSLCFVGSMWLLNLSDRHPLRAGLACLAAVVCSFSFSAGLAAWGAGALVLTWRLVMLRAPDLRKGRLRTLGFWTLAGIGTLALYLHGYVKPAHHPDPWFFIAHPGRAFYFFLVVLGSSLATEVNTSGAAAMGLALVVVMFVLGYAIVRGWVNAEAGAFAVPLIAFALVVAAMVTVGRVGFWSGEGPAAGATSSRYTTLTLLGVLGSYRACLALRADRLRTAGMGGVAALLLVGTFVTLDSAYPLGTRARDERREMRAGLLDWRNRSDAELAAIYPSASLFRERAVILERLGLSVFRQAAPHP